MTTYFKYQYKKYLLGLAVVLATASCKKMEDVVVPDFDVSVKKTTYAVNEPVVFEFSGEADLITFWSGASGSEYQYKDRFRVDGKPQLTFTSFQATSIQANSLSVLISKDFSGTYDLESLQKANWTDITSKATLSTGADNTASGGIDLSEFQEPNVPVYIGFKYVGKTGTVQPSWTVKNIAIDNKLPDGTTVSVANIGNLTWGIINVVNSAKIWTSSTTQIQFTSSAATLEGNEDWIITKPLQLDRIARNYGLSVKSNPTTVQNAYTFAGFTKAGTYLATFEAINANKNGKESVVKEIKITVQ